MEVQRPRSYNTAGEGTDGRLPLATSRDPGFSIRMSRTAKPAAKLGKADYELLAQFRYTLRKFLGFSEAAALRHGVTPQQYQVLLAIEGFPERNWLTVGELAEQMQVAHHSAVGLVDRMVALGLVRRTPSQEDRRRVQVTTTAKGLRVLEKLFRKHRAELQTVGPALIGILRQATTLPGGRKGREFASPACAMPEVED